MSKLRIALVQMLVGANKAQNLATASSFVAKAKQGGAELVVLPECFNCPYGTSFFPEYAESLTPGNASFDCMAEAARSNGVWLVAGSVPEQFVAPNSEKKLFNSSMIFSPRGELVAVHRKIHLFRINTEAVKFDEGEVLTAGDTPTVVSVNNDVTCGVGICFDIRFPQLALEYVRQGTSFLVYPGAFNMVTGPVHWELLAKARAVDCQQFVLLCSPARDDTASYVAWGHSMVVDPWGTVLAEAGVGEELVFATMDFSTVASTRQRVPALKGTRTDLYAMEWSAARK
jgi:predicted amidohydrolase